MHSILIKRNFLPIVLFENNVQNIFINIITCPNKDTRVVFYHNIVLFLKKKSILRNF